MHDFTRRSLLQGGTALAAAGALTGPALLEFAKAWAQTAPWKAEKGAKLTVMRWKRFVPAEDDAFNAMVAAFKTATGTEMNVFSESFEDVQPKASVAANTGSGLDLAWGLHTLPQLFPTKVLKMNDVADYLGKKYGGWTDAAAITCKQGNDWLGIPVATIGGYMTYRKSSVEKAGFKEFPKDFPGFLEMCKALKKNNTPAGFPLGHASGDANAWLHWILWGHGAYTVDKDNKVIINSPETVKALEYCKALSDTFIPGVASWNDSSNNKAYPGGRTALHRQRHLDLRRRQGRSDQEGARRGHLSRAVAGRSGRQADRTAALRSDPGVQLHQISERREGLHRLHAGEGKLRQVAVRRARVSHPHAQRLRQLAGVDRRPEEPGVQPGQQARAAGFRHRHARREGGDRDRRLPGGRHVRQLLHRPRGRQGLDRDRPNGS